MFSCFPQRCPDVGAFEAGLAAAREALATSRQSEQEAQASKQRVCYMPATRIVARFKQKVRKKLSSNESQVSKLKTYKTYSQYIQVELDMPGGALESRGELCHRRTAGRKLRSLPHQRNEESHVNVA